MPDVAEMVALGIIQCPVEYNQPAEFPCQFGILLFQHFQKRIVGNTVAHSFQTDGTIQFSVVRVDYLAVSSG